MVNEKSEQLSNGADTQAENEPSQSNSKVVAENAEDQGGDGKMFCPVRSLTRRTNLRARVQASFSSPYIYRMSRIRLRSW